MIFLSMVLLGAVIGFVGAGGAGVTIALLTVGFDVPIHTALAVALAAMVFTMISGTYSHFREHEVEVKTGAIIGLGGVVGAFAGANVSNIIPADLLHFLTGAMMFLSAIILYIKVYQDKWLSRRLKVRPDMLVGKRLYIYGTIAGVINGFLSGTFGIGAAAFIQITLLVVFGVPILKTIGTCMMVILPISAAGGLGYLFNGRLDFLIFLQTLTGLMLGAWFGAKFTHLAPVWFLKFAIVATPTIGAFVMLVK